MAGQTGKNTKEIGLVLQAYFHYSEEVMVWNQAANKKASKASEQLITIASFVIPFTGVILADKSNINPVSLTILAIGLIALLSSIKYGTEQMKVDSQFLLEYQDHNVSRATTLYNNIGKLSLKEALDLADKVSKPEKLPRSSDETNGAKQSYLLWVGLILIAVAIVIIYSPLNMLK